MKKTIGFIGCGNMGKAMIGGVVKSKVVQPENIIVADGYKPNLDSVSDQYGVLTTMDNQKLAQEADIIVLAIKPDIYPAIIQEIKDVLKKDGVIVSIAAGKTIEGMEKAFGKPIKIIRAMPNTPALVSEGMSCICANKAVNEQELEEVMDIFRSFGKVEQVSEELMDVVTAISGSSPAYVFMFIEAMADGAVLEGMPRDKAYRVVAQAVLGSAKMVLDTGKHPGELKDMVCSPGGTTIEAVAALEESGLRPSVIHAVRTCTKKSKEMQK